MQVAVIGVGSTLCIMAREEVRGGGGRGCPGGGEVPIWDFVLWCSSFPPELLAAARTSRSPLPPGPSGLLKVCHFPIETVFMAPHCPGVKPKVPTQQSRPALWAPASPWSPHPNFGSRCHFPRLLTPLLPCPHVSAYCAFSLSLSLPSSTSIPLPHGVAMLPSDHP